MNDEVSVAKRKGWGAASSDYSIEFICDGF